MKRIVILSTVALGLLFTGLLVVRAETSLHGWRGHRWHRFGPADVLAHQLQLTPAQRAQIHTIWQAERPIVSAQLHDLLAENKEMNAAASAGPDSPEVRKVAEREAQTLAGLLVEKERMQSKIDTTVLDAAQRAKANQLREKWESHLDRFADRLAAPPTDN